MSSGLWFEIIAILILVGANGFFALAEFSVISSRASRLARNRDDRKWGAARAERLKSEPDRFLASIQVGITLVAALLGVFSGATVVVQLESLFAGSRWGWLADSATSVAMVIVVFGITVLSVVLGELVPKYIALSHPERYARYVAGPVNIFVTLTAPFSRLLSWMANLTVRLIGIKRADGDQQVTEEEINEMLLDGRRHGVFDLTEQEFVRSVFDFSDSTVRRALTPRTDVIAINRNASAKVILDTIIEHGYSRYPIFEDTVDKVVGVIYTKDLIDRQIDLQQINLADLMREPLFVPDSLPLPKLLREFQQGRGHLAVVLDEFGGTAGVITLEDILEELVGEIQDEYDVEAAPIVKHSDTLLFADGDVWPGDANEVIDSHLPESEHDTLAGLIMDTLGRLPEEHEAMTIADVRLTILSKDRNRILRLKLEKIEIENDRD
jgi:CBS domain containing-hemolysin-like protein